MKALKRPSPGETAHSCGGAFLATGASSRQNAALAASCRDTRQPHLPSYSALARRDGRRQAACLHRYRACNRRSSFPLHQTAIEGQTRVLRATRGACTTRASRGRHASTPPPPRRNSGRADLRGTRHAWAPPYRLRLLPSPLLASLWLACHYLLSLIHLQRAKPYSFRLNLSPSISHGAHHRGTGWTFSLPQAGETRLLAGGRAPEAPHPPGALQHLRQPRAFLPLPGIREASSRRGLGRTWAGSTATAWHERAARTPSCTCTTPRRHFNAARRLAATGECRRARFPHACATREHFHAACTRVYTHHLTFHYTSALTKRTHNACTLHFARCAPDYLYHAPAWPPPPA